MDSAAIEQDQGRALMQTILWLGGGISVGTAMLFLIGGFGDPGFGLVADGIVQPAATAFSRFGYDASLNLHITSNGIVGGILLATGICMMVIANAGAWKDTGGEY
jgi:hypothetical protein